MADGRTQQERAHDRVGPGDGTGRQRDAQQTGPTPGAPKRPS